MVNGPFGSRGRTEEEKKGAVTTPFLSGVVAAASAERGDDGTMGTEVRKYQRFT